MWFSLHNNKLDKMFGIKHRNFQISVGFLIIILAANCFVTINGLSIAGDRGKLLQTSYRFFLSSFNSVNTFTAKKKN